MTFTYLSATGASLRMSSLVRCPSRTPITEYPARQANEKSVAYYRNRGSSVTERHPSEGVCLEVKVGFNPPDSHSSVCAENPSRRVLSPLMRHCYAAYPGNYFIELRTGASWEAWCYDPDYDTIKIRFEYQSENLPIGGGVRVLDWKGSVLLEKQR